MQISKERIKKKIVDLATEKNNNFERGTNVAVGLVMGDNIIPVKMNGLSVKGCLILQMLSDLPFH